MIIGIPVFPKLALAGLYAIHPFGRSVVPDLENRPGNWMYIAWIFSIVLFTVYVLAYWFLCLPILLLMAIFYGPYARYSINILKILGNPLGFKTAAEGEEYIAMELLKSPSVVAAPDPPMPAVVVSAVAPVTPTQSFTLVAVQPQQIAPQYIWSGPPSPPMQPATYMLSGTPLPYGAPLQTNPHQ